MLSLVFAIARMGGKLCENGRQSFRQCVHRFRMVPHGKKRFVVMFIHRSLTITGQKDFVCRHVRQTGGVILGQVGDIFYVLEGIGRLQITGH